MKRVFAIALAALLLLFMLPLRTTEAEERGELLITSETVSGAVRDVVKVNFYLYPNLPADKRLDSISGILLYDSELLTFGAFNLSDEEHGLDSLMNGKASLVNYNPAEPGVLRFAFIDAYGVEKDGFWFQAEFRIEKEGASAFVFNGFTYSCIDSENTSESFYIDPVSVGGVHTEGESVPTDAADQVTFAPLSPLIEETPGSGGQPVPITSELPVYSGNPQPTDAPIDTPEPTEQPTDTPEPTEQPADTPAPTVQLTDTPAPIETPTEEPAAPEPQNAAAFPLRMVLIAGIVAVLALLALAIVLILIRKKRMENDE